MSCIEHVSVVWCMFGSYTSTSTYRVLFNMMAGLLLHCITLNLICVDLCDGQPVVVVAFQA